MRFRDYLFTKIEFRSCDLLVPFVCLKCGTCCSGYVPRIPAPDLQVIARYIGKPEKTFIEVYREAYRQHLAGHTVRCILHGNNLCSIYDHPLRPEVCDLYPFSFESGDMRCPAYREHLYLVRVLTSGRSGFILYDSSFCPNRDRRPVPEPMCPETLHRFFAAGPSLGVVRAFAAINGLSIPFLVRTMHDTHLAA